MANWETRKKEAKRQQDRERRARNAKMLGQYRTLAQLVARRRQLDVDIAEILAKLGEEGHR
jgi:hypothetical protein